MTIEGHGLTNTFLLQDVAGNHDFDNDSFKLALFTNDENLSPTTTATYATSTNEVTWGSGASAQNASNEWNVVAAGGVDLDITVSLQGESVELDFADLEFASVPNPTTIRGAVIYNSNLSVNNAVAIVNLEEDQHATTGKWSLYLSKTQLGHPLLTLNKGAVR